MAARATRAWGSGRAAPGEQLRTLCAQKLSRSLVTCTGRPFGREQFERHRRLRATQPWRRRRGRRRAGASRPRRCDRRRGSRAGRVVRAGSARKSGASRSSRRASVGRHVLRDDARRRRRARADGRRRTSASNVASSRARRNAVDRSADGSVVRRSAFDVRVGHQCARRVRIDGHRMLARGRARRSDLTRAGAHRAVDQLVYESRSRSCGAIHARCPSPCESARRATLRFSAVTFNSDEIFRVHARRFHARGGPPVPEASTHAIACQAPAAAPRGRDSPRAPPVGTTRRLIRSSIR